MSSTSERAGLRRRRRFSHRPTTRAPFAALVGAGVLVLTSACGMDVQTLQPYTPAEGANFDVGNSQTDEAIHVRNLLIISKEPGVGVISGAISTYGRDQLTGITGKGIKVDGSEGAEFTATLGTAVSVANGTQIQLSDLAPITVRSPELVAGQTASLTLTFASAGVHPPVRVAIADGNQPQYASITPAPAPRS